tara:strand:+ start:224 stop:388 length:165 start_codon:yes stop_codon:yes gene_type:complete
MQEIKRKRNTMEKEIKKEFYLLCKSIKDKTISRSMLIAYANSYINSQKLNKEKI